MEKLNKTLKNNEKAITLIALVITIIVLLILAGISISMLSGNNSILGRATNAKEETTNSQIEEKVKIAYAGAVATGTGNVTEELFNAELEKQFGENGYELSTDETANEWVVKVNNVERLRVSKGSNNQSNIEKLRLYFNGKTYSELEDEYGDFKDDNSIGIKGSDFSHIPINTKESEDGNYYYIYIKYKTKIYKIKGNNTEPYTFTDDIVEVALNGSVGLCDIDGNTVLVQDDGSITALMFFIEKGTSKNIANFISIEEMCRYLEDEELEYTSQDLSRLTVDSDGNITAVDIPGDIITVKGKTSNKKIDIRVDVLTLN